MKQSPDIDETLERGYNARAARDDYDEVLKDWTQRSETVRAECDTRLDVAYGRTERQRLDCFMAGTDSPTLVYLHGGYWQRGDKSAYSFVATPFVSRGVNVVVMNYTLCPRTTVPGIVEEIRAGLAWLHHNGRQFGLSAERINVTGHSAGGHLTAMMLATDWPRYDGDLPRDLVKCGIPVSGLYDLSPLRYTSINQLAGIDDDAARHCSPQLLKPACDAPVLAVVGGAETGVFHEQADAFVKQWSAHGTRAEMYVEPGVDHFDIVNRLASGDSGLFRTVLDRLV